MLQAGKLQQEIANALGRCKSVISREIRRNRDLRTGEYKAQLAENKYRKRLKEKPKKVIFTEDMKQMVRQKLREKLSPEQVVGWCKEQQIACVSVEWIYQYIWQDKKRNGKLYKDLRHKGKRYRKRGNEKDSRGMLAGRVSIEERPAIVELKERFGDLEIDTVIGKKGKAVLLTINDRATGLLRMKKVSSRKAEPVKQATLELLQDWKPLLHTITADNGKEFALHQVIKEELEVGFYFAHPYHSWERGANENLNGLVRQYVPKGTCIDRLTDEFILSVQNELNERPRKRFNFMTPNQMFNLKVAFVS